MAAENVLATQVTLGLLGSGLLNVLKKSTLVSFVNQNSTTLNHLILLATSAAGAIGVHFVWNASGHSLTITGLDLATIAASLWIWSKQWAIQFLVHRGAFGAVSTNGAVVATANSAAQVSKQGFSPGVKRSSLARLAFACFAFVAIAAALMFAGCAAGKYSAAKTNQTVTTVIADAGTVAISAEQSYQAGKIPQTAAARTAINDLGAAYNTAKDVYGDVLRAEALYNASQLAQVTQCQPASVQGGVNPDPAKCQAATQAATNARGSLDAAEGKLTDSLNALSTKTAAVKALGPVQ
jgi:hypothetical protein